MKQLIQLFILLFLTVVCNVSFAQFNQNHHSLSESEPDSVVHVLELTNDKNEKIRPAEFRGGLKELAKYLSKKQKYPRDAKKLKIEGTVYVSFVVGLDGQIKKESVKVVKSLFKSCDEEAIRIISSSPKWNPQINLDTGEKMETRFVLPIKFKLRNNE
jgi:TonB family protein